MCPGLRSINKVMLLSLREKSTDPFSTQSGFVKSHTSAASNMMFASLFKESWRFPTIAIALSSFFILLTLCYSIYSKTKISSRRPLPYLKGSKFILYCSVLTSICKRSNFVMDIIMCHLLRIGCGLCLLFERERIFHLYISMKSFVVFYKPETIEAVLSSTVIIEKAKEYNFLQPWLGTGLLTSSGKKWRNRRKLLTPSFHFRILEDFVPIFDEQSNILVSKIREMKQTFWIDIVPLVTSCTLDIICETAMGVTINAQRGGCSEYVQAIHDIGNIFLYRVLRPWLYLDIIFILSSSGRKFDSDLKTIHNFTRKVIKEKKKEMMNENRIKENIYSLDTGSPMNTKKRKAFLELLLEHHLKDSSFTEEDIREEVDTFMFEGHDTTAMALCWCLYCVGLDEEVQRQIHEELDDIFEDNAERGVTRDDLARMKYLECVIKETLRLYPSVPFIGREIRESFNLLDYKIERGSVAFIFPWMLHRDPVSFPNPEKFDPNRFSPENVAKRHPFAYVPFSAGPRNCIGQKFALMEEKTILANIFRNFFVTSKDPRDKVDVTPNLIIRNLTPLNMHFTPRNQCLKNSSGF